MLLVPRLVRNKLIPCYHQITFYMQIKCVELENKEFKFFIRKSWVWWIRMSRIWIVNVLQSSCVIVTAFAHFNEIVITLIRKLKTCCLIHWKEYLKGYSSTILLEINKAHALPNKETWTLTLINPAIAPGGILSNTAEEQVINNQDTGGKPIYK